MGKKQTKFFKCPGCGCGYSETTLISYYYKGVIDARPPMSYDCPRCHWRISGDDFELGETDNSKCFVATAIFSSNSLQVAVLKEIRDTRLITCDVGRALIKIYYKYSPYLAVWLTTSKLIRIHIELILNFIVTLWLMKNKCWKRNFN